MTGREKAIFCLLGISGLVLGIFGTWFEYTTLNSPELLISSPDRPHEMTLKGVRLFVNGRAYWIGKLWIYVFLLPIVAALILDWKIRREKK
jgi:hypothetical protein